MASLAQHVPAIAAGESRVAVEAGSSPVWCKFATEVFFLLGLFAACAALVALRMALVPLELIPRPLAFAGFGIATVGAIAAFAGAGWLRGRDAIDG